MSEPSPNRGASMGESEPGRTATGGAAGRDVEEGAFPRLQERSQAQLGFINSLLVTLAIGLLAFAANASASSSELDRLGWRKWLLFVGLLLLASSVLAGLRLAFNRLASHRITTRVARLRQLRDRYRSEHRQYELRRLGRQAVFFEGWAKYSWTKVPEKKGVRGAAKELGNLIPEQYKVRGRENPPRGKLESPAGGSKEGNPAKVAIDGIPAAATGLVEALRPDLAQLVRSGIVVDAVDGFAEVAGEGVGGGDDVASGLDLDGAVAAGGADEFPD
jgi:hypothetical protein